MGDDLLVGLSEAQLRDRFVSDTQAALTMLESLRTEPATPLTQRVTAAFPEVAALAWTPHPHAAVDHEESDAANPRPLLEHALRVLGRKLRGLETGDVRVFQQDEALSPEGFDAEVARLERVRDAGLLPALRAALIYLDFAKGGTPRQRARWEETCGADLEVHNIAARRILECTERASHPQVLDACEVLRVGGHAPLVHILVESHGLTGQAVRGETPLTLFAPLVDYLLANPTQGDGLHPALECLHLVNVCDTAGVREGLLTDALAEEMFAILQDVADAAASDDPRAELARRAHAPDHWRVPRGERPRLIDRLQRLRRGRIDAGETPERTAEVVESLDHDTTTALLARFDQCQLWYAESATAGLTPAAQLKVFCLGIAAADAEPDVDVARPFHVNFLPLVAQLHDAQDRKVRYRIRLIEALLAQHGVDDILAAAPATARLRDTSAEGETPLATFPMSIGGDVAVAVTFAESEEAQALVTLLSIYETKSSAAFHATLKTLCDLYGLRKDEFDRVANEELYLATMNSSRSDKARMLDHARRGRIVEVGPGGGVVLDLIGQAYPDSEIIGIDISTLVIEALEARKAQEGRDWRLIEADALELPRHVGDASVDTVVFCSILHEIYSYNGFRLEPVRDLLRAAWRSLVSGGRILIRDGVAPPDAVRILEFLDPAGREFFELFASQFEGFELDYEILDDGRIRLPAHHAMEFLYTYTWGADSFPYEVREQYGVMTYEAYRDQILEWLGGGARWVELPPEERSYLQSGYERGLGPLVRHLDENGQPVKLPDSNCLLVFEKT